MDFRPVHLLFLCIIAFFAMAGGAVLAPVLPFMVEPLGSTESAIGLLVTVYTISTAIFTLVIATLVDRMDRKAIIVPCLTIYGATGLISFFVQDFELLLMLRFIQGMGVAGMMSLAMLVIGDVYEDKLHAMSRVSITIAIGTITAPLIGGLLAGPGWNYPFLFYALALPFAFIVFLFLPETRDREVTSEGFGNIKLLFGEKRVVYMLMLAFAIFFLLYCVAIYVPFKAKNVFGMSADEAGLLLAFQGLAFIMLAGRIQRFSKRWSLCSIIFYGFVLESAALLLLSQAGSVAGLFVTLMLFGGGAGLAHTAMDTRIVEVSPPAFRGSALSVYNSMKYVGMSLSPPFFGFVLLNFGITEVFLFAGIFAGLVALIVRIFID